MFFDESVATGEIANELVDCKTIVSHTSRKIFAAKESWFELIKELKRAA